MAAENKPRKSARRKAVALRYDQDRDDAPTVVAKGAGHLAERIIALAREHGVQIHEDPELAGLLSKVEMNSEIPADLYRAVAEVLAFVYRLNRGFGVSEDRSPS